MTADVTNLDQARVGTRAENKNRLHVQKKSPLIGDG